jgi:hypothetical protein
MQELPLTCRPLADWLGQTVRFQAYLNHWETANKTGDTAFLLRNVKVVPYKGCKEQMRILDHIWIYANKETIHTTAKFERYGGYAALGKVISYRRSNGTKDFAIDIKPYVPIESHLSLLRSYGGVKLDKIQARTLILKETLNLLEIEELDFGIYLPYKEVYQQFKNEYDFWHSQVEVNKRYQEQARQQYRSRPKTKIVKFTSATAKPTKVVSRGFATSEGTTA